MTTPIAAVRLGDVAARVEFVRGEVTDRDSLGSLMDGVDGVDAARRAGARRFINMSQNGADSASPYRFLRSKGMAQD
jgi:hypothetical protein